MEELLSELDVSQDDNEEMIYLPTINKRRAAPVIKNP